MLLACLTLLSCMPACQGAASDAVVLKNENGMEVYILPTGATIQRLLIPDGKGNVTDVALGFDDEQAYKVCEPWTQVEQPCSAHLVERTIVRVHACMVSA